MTSHRICKITVTVQCNTNEGRGVKESQLAIFRAQYRYHGLGKVPTVQEWTDWQKGTFVCAEDHERI